MSYSSRRPRAAPLAYSPNWCPDITLIHGARDGNHALVDAACPSVVTRAALPAARHMPLATAIADAATKHARYGNVKVLRRKVALEIHSSKIFFISLSCGADQCGSN